MSTQIAKPGITVLSNPAGQACTVANPTGTATANVANVNVSCTTLAATAYTIGGTAARTRPELEQSWLTTSGSC